MKELASSAFKYGRSGAVLLPLLGASCGDLSRNDQGILQPQTVRGPCDVKKFFLLSLRSVPTTLTIANTGEACRFTLLDANLQIALTAALVTGPAAHGRATADLITAGRQAEISYTPQPGYTGPDEFSITLEPRAVGITVAVTVRPGR